MTIQNTTPTPKTDLPAIKMVDEIIHLEATKRGLDKQIKDYREKLMQVIKKNKVVSLKTDKYIITKAVRKTIRVIDDARVKKDLEKMGHQVLTKEVIDMRYMKALIEDNVQDLEGASKTETEYLSIRINK